MSMFAVSGSFVANTIAKSSRRPQEENLGNEQTRWERLGAFNVCNQAFMQEMAGTEFCANCFPAKLHSFQKMRSLPPNLPTIAPQNVTHSTEDPGTYLCASRLSWFLQLFAGTTTLEGYESQDCSFCPAGKKNLLSKVMCPTESCVLHRRPSQVSPRPSIGLALTLNRPWKWKRPIYNGGSGKLESESTDFWRTTLCVRLWFFKNGCGFKQAEKFSFAIRWKQRRLRKACHL